MVVLRVPHSRSVVATFQNWLDPCSDHCLDHLLCDARQRRGSISDLTAHSEVEFKSNDWIDWLKEILLAMAAAIAQARRSQSLLKFVLPQTSCALAGSESRSRALDSSSARSEELSLWRNYLKGLVSVRTMATFNRKWDSPNCSLPFYNRIAWIAVWKYYWILLTERVRWLACIEILSLLTNASTTVTSNSLLCIWGLVPVGVLYSRVS